MDALVAGGVIKRLDLAINDMVGMWHLFCDLLLVSAGMGIGVVLMCILQVGKAADEEMKNIKAERNEDK